MSMDLPVDSNEMRDPAMGSFFLLCARFDFVQYHDVYFYYLFPFGGSFTMVIQNSCMDFTTFENCFRSKGFVI